MTSTLDIIDTVVKIGLGALISGITTYLITRKSHKHELDKKLLEDRKEILLEIISKVKKSTTLKNQAVFSIFLKLKENYNNKDKSLIKINHELEKIADSINELGIAISYSYLINLPELGELIEKQYQYYEDLRKHFVNFGLDYDLEFLENITVKVRGVEFEMRDVYKSAIESTYNRK